MAAAKRVIRGLAEVVLNCSDLETMRRFYVDSVGLEFHSQYPEQDPTFYFLTIADLQSPLGLGGHPQLFALVDARRHIHTRDTFQGLDVPRSTLNHVAFEIDRADYESEKERLDRLGLELNEVQFPNLKARAIFFNDPEGNLLEFICHDA